MRQYEQYESFDLVKEYNCHVFLIPKPITWGPRCWYEDQGFTHSADV